MSKKVSNSTLKQYNSTYRLFCSDLNLNDPYGSFLKLCYKVSQRSKQLISNETIKTALSAIVYNLREKNESPEIINEYLLLITHMRKLCMYKTQNPIINAEKIPEWSYLLEMKDYWRDSNEINSDIYYVLAGVYTVVPPRRIADYVNMFTYNGEENPINPVNLKNSNDTKNYFYYNNSFEDNPAYFIFNNYKTKKTYGSQIFKVPDELKFTLLEYIENRDLKHDTNLFLLKSTEGQGKIQFYRLLQNTFQCSVDAIRHSYISHMFENDIPSTQELKNNSIFMAHSISMHLDYRKILKTDDIQKDVSINIDPELLNYINPNSIYAKKLLKFDAVYNNLLKMFETLFLVIFIKIGLSYYNLDEIDFKFYKEVDKNKVNKEVDKVDKNKTINNKNQVNNLDLKNDKNKVSKVNKVIKVSKGKTDNDDKNQVNIFDPKNDKNKVDNNDKNQVNNIDPKNDKIKVNKVSKVKTDNNDKNQVNNLYPKNDKNLINKVNKVNQVNGLDPKNDKNLINKVISPNIKQSNKKSDNKPIKKQ